MAITENINYTNEIYTKASNNDMRLASYRKSRLENIVSNNLLNFNGKRIYYEFIKLYYHNCKWLFDSETCKMLASEQNNKLEHPLLNNELKDIFTSVDNLTKLHHYTNKTIIRKLNLTSKEASELGFVDNEKKKSKRKHKKKKKETLALERDKKICELFTIEYKNARQIWEILKPTPYHYNLDAIRDVINFYGLRLAKGRKKYQDIDFTKGPFKENVPKKAKKIPDILYSKSICNKQKPHNHINLTDKQNKVINDLQDSNNPIKALFGPGGSGKSAIIKELQKILDEKGKKYLSLAPTGIAGINIGGSTFDKGCNFPIFVEDCYNKINPLPDEFINADYIFIDEISMLSPDRFQYLLKCTEFVYKKKNNRQIIVLSGDYNQLPCVCTGIQLYPYLNSDNPESELRNYPFNKFLFLNPDFANANCVPYILTENMRQKNDKIFSDKLNRMFIEREFDDTINELFTIYDDESEICNALIHNDILTYIASTNKKVNHINDRCIELLIKQQGSYAKVKKYDAKIKEYNNCPETIQDGTNIYSTFSEEHLPAPKTLTLAVGTKVMILINDKKAKPEYANGSLGTVTELGEDYINVKLCSTNKEVCIKRHPFPNISYTYNKHCKQYNIHHRIKSTFEQFPLTPAYAITAHKVQGLTLERVIINPDGCFEFGQLYTMMSRVRSAKDIILTRKLKREDIIISMEIYNFLHFLKNYNRCYNVEEASSLRAYYKAVYDYKSFLKDIDMMHAQYNPVTIQQLHPKQLELEKKLSGLKDKVDNILYYDNLNNKEFER